MIKSIELLELISEFNLSEDKSRKALGEEIKRLVEQELEPAEELLAEVLDWYKSRSAPSDTYKYSRCPICRQTWWDGKEKHNFGCWIPRLESLAKIEEKQ